MVTSIQIIIKPQDEKNTKYINSLVQKEIANRKIAGNLAEHLVKTVFEKKSIDARHGQVKLCLKYKVYIDEEPGESQTKLPEWKKADGNKKVVIVGAGPAGLFGALKLLEKGIKPVIIERGCETVQRRKDIALISTQDKVNPDSNYCFGEGGAGTFSDGKLYTRSNKRGNIDIILQIFNHFGADEKILTDAHPHIGTDKLPKVINNMRDFILAQGGEIHFNTRVVDFKIDEKTKTVLGVVTQNTQTDEKNEFTGDAVLLATGHSAPDIYNLIARISPQSLEAKTFAIGVRVEHPRTLIDTIQFHGKQGNMPAAEYRVTAQVEDRGVYSFCMCPGGFVVPSSSGPDEIVVNGMSTAARNSKWSNAAIVVETRPEDIPQKFQNKAREMNCPQLAGLLFRTELEKLAKQNGNGQAAPAQLMKDFLADRKSKEIPQSSYTPGLVSSNLNDWLPPQISRRLAGGFEEINKNMKGFICDEALMIAIETRTSTPVRITRDKESFECTSLRHLYPAGEGSGYSGGIVSSAMDGENACEKIAEKL